MSSVRVYDVSDQLYIVREEQRVEDLTLELWIIHNQIETESVRKSEKWKREVREERGEPR